jgi:hypothetical protein
MTPRAPAPCVTDKAWSPELLLLSAAELEEDAEGMRWRWG